MSNSDNMNPHYHPSFFHHPQQQQGFHPFLATHGGYNTSFAAYNHPLQLTPSCEFSNGCFPLPEEVTVNYSTNPATPNSSVSLVSSPEGGPEENHASKIENIPASEASADAKSNTEKGKSKLEQKKQRQPRFAFMTKSEVDNLEDGYRWRKYGQKAVKTSPFPRSYYRCTSQKCNVKKRIQRSFEDPTVVITTYEGQHNHHYPTTVRGGAAAVGVGPQDLFLSYHNNPSGFGQHQEMMNPPQQQHLLDHHEYGLLLHGMVSSFLHK